MFRREWASLLRFNRNIAAYCMATQEPALRVLMVYQIFVYDDDLTWLVDGA